MTHPHTTWDTPAADPEGTAPGGTPRAADPECTAPAADPEDSAPVTAPRGTARATGSESSVPETGPEDTTPVADPEGTTSAAGPESTAPATGPEGIAPVADPEGTTPVAGPKGTTPAADPENTTPAAGPKGTAPAAGPKGTAPAADPENTTPSPTPSSPADLRDRLIAHLDGSAREWLDRALGEAAAQPGIHGPISVWELRLAEAGRRCGAEHADAARMLIMHSARAGTDALTRVYSQGTAAERRSVLQALPHLVEGPDALPLVEDALRTNDTRILAAAVGPYAARHLAPHHWRHAVLKCLFTGVPVAEVADLDRRAHADAELARMLRDYAAERTAAGRPVPEDLHRVLTLTDPTATPPAQTVRHGARGTDGKES